MPRSTLADRCFLARAILALLLAQLRYWTSVAPLVRAEMRLWGHRAAQIEDPFLRELALQKLADERFNSEVAAMVATSAPATFRKPAVRAIVAFQVMYDYLDALTEQPTADPIRDGLCYYKAFLDAVTVAVLPTEDYYAHHPGPGDGGYLADLAIAVRAALLKLPAIDAISGVIPRRASDCAEAQVRIHALPTAGLQQLELWATLQARDSELQWREWLFGAMGSVVAAHALIAAAADERTTPEHALAIDTTYLSLCVLTTALDHLVDYEQDVLAGEHSYLEFYDSPELFSEQLADVIARVMKRVRTLPNSAHHAMLLAGVIAYYTSQPSARGEFARPVTERVQQHLRPLLAPTLATMYAWRLLKRARDVAVRLRAADTRPSSLQPSSSRPETPTRP